MDSEKESERQTEGNRNGSSKEENKAGGDEGCTHRRSAKLLRSENIRMQRKETEQSFSVTADQDEWAEDFILMLEHNFTCSLCVVY